MEFLGQEHSDVQSQKPNSVPVEKESNVMEVDKNDTVVNNNSQVEKESNVMLVTLVLEQVLVLGIFPKSLRKSEMQITRVI